ncbi:MAG: enoyl-CoA hydratase-related protein [Betaproteobacteria bacterium]|nr:enoyl-CoA hydratase-related protein [Betaproteobacteria bacterium]
MDILLQEERDGVLILTLNRPQAHNALSSELAEHLYAVLEATAERRDVRVIVLLGAGDKAFCAGTDLKERRDLTPDEKWAQRTRGWRVNQFIWRMPQPVIALIHGWCLGGGFELALFCDLRIAAPDAVFSFPEMTLGAYPGSGAAIVLPRTIGRSRAKELFFTARRVTADEALELGIVEWVVPREQLLDKALELAEQIKGTSPLGVGAVKRMVNLGADLSFDAAADLNDALRRPLEATKDYEEGIRAFFEKRKPAFRGE